MPEPEASSPSVLSPSNGLGDAPVKDLRTPLKTPYRRKLSLTRSGRTGKLEQSFAMAVRHFLEEKQKKDAQNPEGKSRMIRILENVARIAMSSSKLSVQAATLLIDRGYGKASPSEAEADAIAKGGLKIVFVQRPELAEPARPALPPAVPDFVEGEFREGVNGHGQ